jgi:hypothetical protein
MIFYDISVTQYHLGNKAEAIDNLEKSIEIIKVEKGYDSVYAAFYLRGLAKLYAKKGDK